MAGLAQKLAVRIKLSTLLPVALCALACLLAYGSLSMWAGYCIGTGQTHTPMLILRMPSGLLVGGLFWLGGMFLGVHAGREFAKGDNGWRKKMFISLAMLVPGGAALALVL